MTMPGLLSEEEIAFYKAEGYLILRRVFEAHEIDQLGADVDRVCREHADLMHPDNMRARFKPHHATNEMTFEVFDPIADLSPVAWNIAHDRRIFDRLHDLYGEPAELFKEK